MISASIVKEILCANLCTFINYVKEVSIIESVDSISRDDPDMPYNYVIHYKVLIFSI